MDRHRFMITFLQIVYTFLDTLLTGSPVKITKWDSEMALPLIYPDSFETTNARIGWTI